MSRAQFSYLFSKRGSVRYGMAYWLPCKFNFANVGEQGIVKSVYWLIFPRMRRSWALLS